jgi:hypothetical protein
MITIWKYSITHDAALLKMPKGAEILTVQLQGDTPTLWALVDTEAEPFERAIEVCGTGWPLDSGVNRKYIGTFQISGFGLVFHVFEVEDK